MKPTDVEELAETRSVKSANGLLQAGYQLLEINCTPRGPVYVLGARSVSTLAAANLLPE